jgi:hypothetical protein
VRRGSDIWPLIAWSTAFLAFTAFIFWLTRNYWTLWLLALSFRWLLGGGDADSGDRE